MAPRAPIRPQRLLHGKRVTRAEVSLGWRTSRIIKLRTLVNARYVTELESVKPNNNARIDRTTGAGSQVWSNVK